MPDVNPPETSKPPDGTNTAWTIVAGCLFIGVLAGVAAYTFLPKLQLDIPNRELTDAEIDEVFRVMQLPLLQESLADQTVEEYGWQALPFLHAVIQDEAAPVRNRSHAAYIAGKYRHSETAALIIDFVQERLSTSMSQEDFSAVAMALDGLGFTGRPNAVEYLEQITRKEYWETMDEPPSLLNSDDTHHITSIVRQRGVRALGLAPGGNGIDALKRVRKESPDLAEFCDKAIDDGRRRKWGLNRLDGL